MNCFALNPLPPKCHMVFFHEQIKLRVAPNCLFPFLCTGIIFFQLEKETLMRVVLLLKVHKIVAF